MSRTMPVVAIAPLPDLRLIEALSKSICCLRSSHPAIHIMTTHTKHNNTHAACIAALLVGAASGQELASEHSQDNTTQGSHPALHESVAVGVNRKQQSPDGGGTPETSKGLSLKQAIMTLNERAARYFDVPGLRSPPLPQDQRPAPCTEAEIMAAIHKWDRTKSPSYEKGYQIFQRISETKRLPADASLYFDCHWYSDNDQDKYEYRTWRIALDVMISTNAGCALWIRDQKLDRCLALRPALGYSWIEAPYPIESGEWCLSRRTVLCVERDKEESLVATVAYSQSLGIEDLHAVAFDEEGRRYTLADRWGDGAVDNILLRRFRLDPGVLRAAEARFLGVEALSKESLREISETAIRHAKEKGIHILPLPEVGRPYEFLLTTLEGAVVDSETLRGKVVMIDCWASWCGPCMSKMPELKEIYRKWHPQGLELIGLSFDQDAKAAGAAFKRYEIPWPLVLVPTDQQERQLWTAATRIIRLPRILLLDQQGVLRFDLTSEPWQLDETIKELFGKPSIEPK